MLNLNEKKKILIGARDMLNSLHIYIANMLA